MLRDHVPIPTHLQLVKSIEEMRKANEEPCADCRVDKMESRKEDGAGDAADDGQRRFLDKDASYRCTS